MNEGAKLTIINTSGAPVTISYVDGNNNSFFYNNGELHLGDNSSERIILDGGANFNWNVDAHKLLPESSKAVQRTKARTVFY